MNGPAINAATRERFRPRKTFWLIVGDDGGSGTLTLDLPGRGEALAVFCHPEEAEMFLRVGPSGRSRRPRKASAAELVSVLSGPRAGVGWVALDPLPEECVVGGLVGLVSLRRERFLKRFVGYGPEETPRTSTTIGGKA